MGDAFRLLTSQIIIFIVQIFCQCLLQDRSWWLILSISRPESVGGGPRRTNILLGTLYRTQLKLPGAIQRRFVLSKQTACTTLLGAFLECRNFRLLVSACAGESFHKVIILLSGAVVVPVDFGGVL